MLQRHIFLTGGIATALLLGLLAPFQKAIFDVPYTTVVFDLQSNLLGARIAKDGQWRFPETDTLPPEYVQAVILFEDKFFFRHPGIDLTAIARAAWINLKNGGVKQGGSTLTMQVARLSFGNKPRTYFQKIKEIVLALRLEIHYSKPQILQLYASHAPMGGNVVGLDAAAWRYFSRAPHQLSIAEYALLAVLPNAPAALHPGRNTEMLMTKRNKLLDRMHAKGIISETDCILAKLENLPANPYPLPDYTPHLTQWALLNHPGKQLTTTIALDMQQHCAHILARHNNRLASNGVHNAAIIVTDIKTGRVLVYHGNTNAGIKHNSYVDVATAPRSSGSILKPFLFAAMQQTGQLLPDELVTDIPTFIAGFNPLNYSRDYSGAVSASDALARSLNVPAVRQLRDFGVERFKQELQNLGFSTLNRSARNYGLSLILGGAEVTLWDVNKAYTAMAQSVINANYTYNLKNIHVWAGDTTSPKISFHSGAAYLTLQALRKTGKSAEQEGWQYYSNKTVAWKTGTSFGYRDAWAVGVNATYAVSVWVGNADGEGRPGVIGAEAAAPIMFEVFSALPGKGTWFTPPYDFMEDVVTCVESGSLASVHCPNTKKMWVTNTGESRHVCKYHQMAHLTKNESYTVGQHCVDQIDVKQEVWFVLPPAMEHYYKKKSAAYRTLPPFFPGCQADVSQQPMQFIYPSNFQYVMAAKQLSGDDGYVIFKLAHRYSNKRVYWHAGEHYLGETKNKHEVAVNLPAGKYILKAIDEDGFEISQPFEML